MSRRLPATTTNTKRTTPSVSTDQPATKENSTLSIPMRNLTVCGTCFALFGFGDDGTTYQHCDCVTGTPDDHDDGGYPGLASNPYGTWSRVAELCRSCGADVVDASTPDAVWFCATCIRWARSLNEYAGYAVVPIGWHTRVNKVVRTARTRSAEDTRSPDYKVYEFHGRSRAVLMLGRKVVEGHLDQLGVPSGQDVPLGLYLRTVRSAPVDADGHFTALAIGLDLGHYWRCHGQKPLDLDWETELTGHRHEVFTASAPTPWSFPDGREGKTRLHCRVVEIDEAWAWEVTVDPEAAGEDPFLLDSGVGDCLGRAASDCGWAALHIKRKRKEHRNGRPGILPPLYEDKAPFPGYLDETCDEEDDRCVFSGPDDHEGSHDIDAGVTGETTETETDDLS